MALLEDGLRGGLTYGTWVMPNVKDIRNPASKIRFAGPKSVFAVCDTAMVGLLCSAEELFAWPMVISLPMPMPTPSPLASSGVLSCAVMMLIQSYRTQEAANGKSTKLNGIHAVFVPPERAQHTSAPEPALNETFRRCFNSFQAFYRLGLGVSPVLGAGMSAIR
jgi:hypothetical protein